MVCVCAWCAWIAWAVAIARVSLHVHVVLVSGGIIMCYMYTYTYNIVSLCMHVGLSVYILQVNMCIYMNKPSQAC